MTVSVRVRIRVQIAHAYTNFAGGNPGPKDGSPGVPPTTSSSVGTGTWLQTVLEKDQDSRLLGRI